MLTAALIEYRLYRGKRVAAEYVDVVVVGAGLSGIGAAYHLQTICPDRSYVILEARHDIGGTWDLFKYPGVRSDSDMHTLGFGFKPWLGQKAIADGPAIMRATNLKPSRSRVSA